MSDDRAYHVSQGLDVLRPKSGPAFPVPCGEWDSLKMQLGRLTREPWFFHTIGSILVGATLSTGIAILLGTFDHEAQAKARIVAWAVVVVTGVCGTLSLLFAHKERDVSQQRASDIVRQMELIEKRFEREVA